MDSPSEFSHSDLRDGEQELQRIKLDIKLKQLRIKVQKLKHSTNIEELKKLASNLQSTVVSSRQVAEKLDDCIAVLEWNPKWEEDISVCLMNENDPLIIKENVDLLIEYVNMCKMRKLSDEDVKLCGRNIDNTFKALRERSFGLKQNIEKMLQLHRNMQSTETNESNVVGFNLLDVTGVMPSEIASSTPLKSHDLSDIYI